MHTTIKPKMYVSSIPFGHRRHRGARAMRVGQYPLLHTELGLTVLEKDLKRFGFKPVELEIAA